MGRGTAASQYRFRLRAAALASILALGLALGGGGCKMKPTPAVLSSPDEGPTSTAKMVTTPGKVLPDKLARSEWTAGGVRSASSGMHSRAVVPLVSSTWKPGDPVPMWVAGGEQHEQASSWPDSLTSREVAEVAWALSVEGALRKGPITGTVTDRVGRDVTGARGPSAELKAVHASEAAHGLTSVPGAPIMHWNP